MRPPRGGTPFGGFRGGTPGRGFRLLAASALIGTYLLIVLGGVVRVTGSGMGCGDDWPLCNGALLPPMDLATLIEYGHRLAAAAISVLVLALAAWSWKPGRGPGWRSLRGWTAAAVGLLLAQILLGAITVWLELPPTSVILHLGTAMALLTVLAVVACRAGTAEPGGRVFDGAARVAVAVAGLGAAAVLAGALVANLDAAPACQGFPLCNGAWWPADNWRVQIHWTHRMVAYALVLATLLLPSWARRARPGDGAARGMAWLAVVLVGIQVGIAAWMVLFGLGVLPRVLHVAVGGAAFAALVIHAWILVHPERSRAGAAAGDGGSREALAATPPATHPAG